MPARVCARALFIILFLLVGLATAASGQTTFKVAYYNIQSGKGEPAMPGHNVEFFDVSNCTDPSQPLNAWGVGLVQRHLQQSIGNDPSIVALGLGEAWLCGSPANVQNLLKWKARTQTKNGVALVARYGFAGPEEWLQLDTSLNPSPADTMWVVRVPVCLDEACSQSMNIFTAHWYSTGTVKSTVYEKQAAQTLEFLARAGGSDPHLLIGDLNVWEGVAACGQSPSPYGLSKLRAAGYLDAWVALHGGAEGFTGMTNRSGCGTPVGYTWKRIDYSWGLPNMVPRSMKRFGIEPAGDGQPSDHFGIIVEYDRPGVVTPPPPTTPPPVEPEPTPAPAPDVTPIPAPSVPSAESTSEIVLYAKNASVISGNYRVVPDASAAGGARMSLADAAAPKLASALAAPAHFFEMTFNAEAGKPYRLWIRGRADRNSWANDSVFVQFSGATDKSGAALYRIGTSSGASVNLEDAANAGISDWGWQDHGYGTNVLGCLVYFAASGPQTIRIQNREDGFSIDQIVLSSQQFLSTPPGSLKNDTVIVPIPVALPPPVSRDEIVIRAASATTLAGAWTLVPDATAAGGSAVTHGDAGGAKVNAASASPANFVEFTFEAEAGKTYRLWIRGRADRDSWANDSVFVQFSGAVSATNAPMWRIGTTDATWINLEEGASTGLASWGWQDNGYGVGILGPTVKFAATGTQTIRIQTREDGMRIDQIVLSSATYLTVSPGAQKNDCTIIP
jgi:hypothetical protein